MVQRHVPAHFEHCPYIQQWCFNPNPNGRPPYNPPVVLYVVMFLLVS
jgi:hypothetical protein